MSINSIFLTVKTLLISDRQILYYIMSSDSNLEILLSKLEEAIDSHELNFSQATTVLNQENICNLFNILKQQTEQLRQEIEQQKNSEVMVQNNQQLLSSFILHIPVAIANLNDTVILIQQLIDN